MRQILAILAMAGAVSVGARQAPGSAPAERGRAGSLEPARTAGAVSAMPGSAATTAHLRLSASASDRVVAPGTRFSLVVDIDPEPKMHVYAPGASGYRPITLAIDPQPDLIVHPLEYPKPEMLFFAPLAETVPVYQKPFRLVQDVTVSASPRAEARLKQAGTLTISGTVAYQACDDKVCFVPVTVPVSWTLDVKGVDGKGSGRRKPHHPS